MSRIYHGPEGLLIKDIEGTPLLLLWPTVLCFPGSRRRICLVGANEDLSPPHTTYNTRKTEVVKERGLITLLIEAVNVNHPFAFVENKHRGGPIMLQRGEEPAQTAIDNDSSAVVRYITHEVMYNTGMLP